MENPRLRYYLDGRVHSDWVEVAVGEAVVVARLQKVEDGTIQWFDQSGLPLGQTDCITHGQETNQSREYISVDLLKTSHTKIKIQVFKTPEAT